MHSFYSRHVLDWIRRLSHGRFLSFPSLPFHTLPPYTIQRLAFPSAFADTYDLGLRLPTQWCASSTTHASLQAVQRVLEVCFVPKFVVRSTRLDRIHSTLPIQSNETQNQPHKPKSTPSKPKPITPKPNRDRRLTRSARSCSWSRAATCPSSRPACSSTRGASPPRAPATTSGLLPPSSARPSPTGRTSLRVRVAWDWLCVGRWSSVY